jgi:hypothetical protein
MKIKREGIQGERPGGLGSGDENPSGWLAREWRDRGKRLIDARGQKPGPSGRGRSYDRISYIQIIPATFEALGIRLWFGKLSSCPPERGTTNRRLAWILTGYHTTSALLTLYIGVICNGGTYEYCHSAFPLNNHYRALLA